MSSLEMQQHIVTSVYLHGCWFGEDAQADSGSPIGLVCLVRSQHNPNYNIVEWSKSVL